MIRTAEILGPKAEQPMCPYDGPLVVFEAGHAILPHPHGEMTMVPIRDGIHLAWTKTPELGGITMFWFAGQDADVGFATSLTREGLRAIIRDLKSIEAQLDVSA